jgi:hypothetical protein
MKSSRIILTTVFSTLTLLAFGSVLATSLLPFGAEAHGFRTGLGGEHHAGASATRGDRGARMLAHCQRLSPAHTRVVEAAISAALDLDDSQQNALAPIMEVLDEWRAQASTTCEQLPSNDVDAGLAAMQEMLNNTANTIGALRPAYGDFYAQLNTEQKTLIDEMIARHHNRH